MMDSGTFLPLPCDASNGRFRLGADIQRFPDEPWRATGDARRLSGMKGGEVALHDGGARRVFAMEPSGDA